ncbi:WYL domain-containing protein [Leptospira sp. GIMC2001]|uniref:WYL domain-containing protein n=1 Tax=Leptospira sp. GIMC2001 TaxID=1513297 RepID=UPI0023498673|nr:WYL domain-containing protein [Leptospira sp. GIMC2001]WCL50729.1 WYL domain-containing protein [Leptospira sp. GIMC2001]
MKKEKEVKSTELYQIRYGLEAFAFAREWIFKPNQESLSAKQDKSIKNKIIKAGELYLFLDELHSYSWLNKNHNFSKSFESETKTSVTEKIRKRYEPYLSLVSQKFGLNISFQDKTLDATYEQNLIRIHSICKDYLVGFAHSYNDSSLELVIRNWNTPGDLLYFLVAIRYAIQGKFPIEIQYSKAMFLTETARKIYPYLIVSTEGHLSLLGKDLKDNKTKSFLVSRIKGFKIDLRNAIENYNQGNEFFNLKDYLQSDPQAKFSKDEITYEFEISNRNLDFFKHTQLFDVIVIGNAKRNQWSRISISSHNERKIFDLLFNYGTFIKLTSPQDAADRFVKELKELNHFYDLER